MNTSSVVSSPYSPLYTETGKSRRLRLDDKTTSDFVIACEGREFFVHRCILTAESPFLRRFLSHDTHCTRINANNASPIAMELVLAAMYNAGANDALGDHHYNASVVTSVWEIAMHFQQDNMTAVATSRLLALIDRDCAFRVLQASLKHPASEHAKTLQQRIVEVGLPPVVPESHVAQWRSMVQQNAWLQDAIEQKAKEAHANVTRVLHPCDDGCPKPTAPASVAAGTHTMQDLGTPPDRLLTTEDAVLSSTALQESVKTIRESYKQYMTIRASSTPNKSFLEDYTSTPTAARGPPQENALAELAASASKLRDAIGQAEEKLLDLTTSIQAQKASDEDDASLRRHTDAPLGPVAALKAEELKRRTEALKQLYSDEMMAYREQRAKLEMAAATEKQKRDMLLTRQRDQLRQKRQEIQAEINATIRAIQDVDNQEAEAEAFNRDADVYSKAAAGALVELQRIAHLIPEHGTRSAVRKYIAGALLAMKENRDSAEARLRSETAQKERRAQFLKAEEADIARLRKILADHEKATTVTIEEMHDCY